MKINLSLQEIIVANCFKKHLKNFYFIKLYCIRFSFHFLLTPYLLLIVNVQEKIDEKKLVMTN